MNSTNAFSRVPRPGDPIATAEQMRAVDARAIGDFGIPGAVLMESAGRACAERLERLAASGQCARRALVLCGPGNNGGDGFVIGRTLRAIGWDAGERFFAAPEPRSRFGPDLVLQLDLAERLGRPARSVLTSSETDTLIADIDATARSGGVVVDALFGTGLARPLTGSIARTLDHLARAGALVFAVDVPSGLCADTGQVLGTACPARWTTTLAALKPGLLVQHGPRLVGELEIAEIGIPPALLADLPRFQPGDAPR
ncbi:NAD(P)H-hydrate epimerase [Planctomycetes bacterium Pla163]|uniref:NAD(P)H-hydrate epimerase n=1 Tax=Rohdeia mirabilis TaxID=2528008 RepID=UPI0011A27544